jgi:TonB family protein
MRKIAPFPVAALLLAGCATKIVVPGTGATPPHAQTSPAARAGTTLTVPPASYYARYSNDGKTLGPTEAAVAHINESNQVLERITAGEFDAPVRLTNSPQPVVPFEVMQQGIEGIVRVRIEFGGSGKVASVKVLRSPDVLLTNAVLEAVWGWTVTPLTKKGKPSSVVVDQEFAFKMEK